MMLFVFKGVPRFLEATTAGMLPASPNMTDSKSIKPSPGPVSNVKKAITTKIIAMTIRAPLKTVS